MYTSHGSPALPKGWVVTTLGEMIEPSAEKVDPLAIEKTPYVGLKHIEKATGVLSGSGWSDDVSSTKSAFHCGDILYGKLRPYLNKVWVADFDGVCSTDILVFPGDQHLSTQFLGFRVLSTDFVDYATQNMTGVQHPRVHFDALRHFPIALPPSAEQRRIVAKIDELFSQLDAGVAALEKAKAQLQRYRQAVFKAAMSGDLTREWREAHKDELEPASALLDRILEERRAKWEAEQLEKMRAKGKVPKDDSWKNKYKEPAAPDMTGLPELPEGWLWTSLDAAAGEIARYPTFYGMEHLEQGVPVIRGEHLNQDGTISHDWDNYWFVSEELSREFPRTIVEVGDLTMSVRGSVGKLGLIDEKLQGAQVSPNCIRISILSRHCLPKVVLFDLMSFRGQSSIRKNVSATTIQTIKASLLSRTAIPVPPLIEQGVIVEEVERRLSVAAETRRAVEQSLKRARRLRQGILKRAFEGKLVAQDPTDEAASVLLERIKADKDKRETEKKTRKKKPRKDTPQQLELI